MISKDLFDEFVGPYYRCVVPRIHDMGAIVMMDSDGLITEEWKPRGLPTSFLIDPQGHVKYQAIGGREWGEPLYTNFINKLVKQSR